MSVQDSWLDEAKRTVAEKTERLRDLVGTMGAVNSKMAKNSQLFEKYPNFAKEARFLEKETEKIGVELDRKISQSDEKDQKETQVLKMTEELARLEEELKQLTEERKKKEQKLIENRI